MAIATSALLAGLIPAAIGAAGGAATGAVKAKMGADKESRDRQLAADTQRYSPWTGLQAGPIEQANPVGDVLQGATAGGMFGQGLGQQLQGGPKFDTKSGEAFFDPQTGKRFGQ